MSTTTFASVSTAQSTPHSTIDKQLSLNIELKWISARLSNVATELIELCHLLLDPYYLNRQKSSFFTSIKATIIPFICAASIKISSSTNILSPIEGANCFHKWNEAKRKSETELNENWEKQRKISYLKLIEHSVSKTSPQQVSINSNGPILNTTRAYQR